MIFQPELIAKIQAGAKTQTRRIKESDSIRYVPGRCYAVQPGRGQAGVCRITITAVRNELLGDLSNKDARREGFQGVVGFYEYWKRLHGKIDREVEVWVISFELGDITDTPRLLRSGTPKSAICAGCKRGLPDHMERCPRCNLARPMEDYSDHGYTSRRQNALSDEPEAISAADQEFYSAAAHERDAERLRDPDVRLFRELSQSLERWESETGGLTSRDRQQTIQGIRRQQAALGRKLRAA